MILGYLRESHRNNAGTPIVRYLVEGGGGEGCADVRQKRQDEADGEARIGEKEMKIGRCYECVEALIGVELDDAKYFSLI